MRISELAALRWNDVDRKANVIKLTDETAQVVRQNWTWARMPKPWIAPLAVVLAAVGAPAVTTGLL